MRPMTVREALQIERGGSPATADIAERSEHARRILEALVEWRDAENAWTASFSGSAGNRALAAERKLEALERGEEPQA